MGRHALKVFTHSVHRVPSERFIYKNGVLLLVVLFSRARSTFRPLRRAVRPPLVSRQANTFQEAGSTKICGRFVHYPQRCGRTIFRRRARSVRAVPVVSSSSVRAFGVVVALVPSQCARPRDIHADNRHVHAHGSPCRQVFANRSVCCVSVPSPETRTPPSVDARRPAKSAAKILERRHIAAARGRRTQAGQFPG